MDRTASSTTENKELEWYGKPAKKTTPKTGDPIICYIVGGTCYSEVGMHAETKMNERVD